MQLRCYRCGWSFGVGRDEILFALESVRQSGGNSYNARCPRCRHANRISLEQLERAAPAPRPASQDQPPPD
jgi:hypothetical protein